VSVHLLYVFVVIEHGSRPYRIECGGAFQRSGDLQQLREVIGPECRYR